MSNSFSLLDGHQFMSLTTFRKNGEPKPTAVWFVQSGDNLIVYTGPESWKVKRIKNNPRIEVSPCERDGKVIGAETAVGTARIMTADEEKAAKKMFRSKYGLMKIFFDLMSTIRREDRVYLEITPGN